MTQRLPAKPKNRARIAAERGGRWAETLAAWYLRAKLYRIRDRRFKTPAGEIDLIAERFGLIAFVEVKARAHASLEYEALEAVNVDRISRAVDYYLMRHPRVADRPMRFDIIFLAPWRWPRHVKAAFEATTP